MLKFCIGLCLFLCVQNDNEPVISWSASYKLSWNDFKGKPRQNVSAVATTASGITFGFSIRQSGGRVVSFTTEVHAHFYPKQSWYKVERADNHILGHEQLHFDITELHARKFRMRISQLEVSHHIKRELNSLHRTINKELAALQDRYDAETDYSRQVEAQLRWQLYIKKELQKLDKYKSETK
ncbi:DUF922 domain-containing protein [Algibacter sp. 2305UL17-15]|uniref:DUF922 domain-containing protein n=1 Tax=Algibacter sp. 2305UL17-15 TaxID=3231268 RepID=UPI003457AC86